VTLTRTHDSSQKQSSSIHTKDSDCTLNDRDCCTVCGVHHSEPCPGCNQRGYHAAGCPEIHKSLHGSAFIGVHRFNHRTTIYVIVDDRPNFDLIPLREDGDDKVRWKTLESVQVYLIFQYWIKPERAA